MHHPDRVGVGVIGTGFGQSVVAPVFESTRGCEVVDVVSPRDEGAVRALCERRDVDLISVHSPPFLHRTHVEWALDAGHAVLCDKPFGTSASDAEAMELAAREAGAVALLNFEFRHHPTRAALRSLIDDGAVGRVEHASWTQYVSVFRRRRPNWLFDAELGGGWIGAWGSHAIDFVRWSLGDVVGAAAELRTAVVDRVSRDGQPQRCTAEDGFTAWLQTEAGATVTMDTTSVSRMNLPQRIVVLGSEGVAEVHGDDRVVLTTDDGSVELFRYTPEGPDPHLLPMQRWATVVRDAVRAGSAPDGEPTFADGVACARVMDALRARCVSE
jgi:predicted dehydrogenase